VELKGRLTPPVAVGGRVYVAAKDEHTIHALGIEDGKAAWRFTAGGRIDSPPTIHGGLVLFGCVDGYVYCLRASDGALAWRFRAAPADQRIIAFGQLESPWRVHGSVLVQDGIAYCTAGRSTHLDGGIYLYGLDPATGKVVHKNRLDTWARTRTDAEGKLFIPAYHIEGSHSDILVSEGESIYLGQYKLDRSLAEQMVPYALPDPNNKPAAMDLTGEPYISVDPKKVQGHEDHARNYVERAMKGIVTEYRKKYGGLNYGNRDVGRHVFATGGFLDDSYFNRTVWMYSGTWPGFYHAHLGAKTGHLLVVGPEKTYALQAYTMRALQSPLFTPGEKGYLLFADRNANEPVLDDKTRETTKGWGFTRKAPPVWHDWVPIRIRGMVLAGDRLFVAGPPDVVDAGDPMAAFEGRKGAVLRVVSAADGKTLAERKLDAPPVFDGLIAAQGRLLMCTTDGKVICFGKGE
jgi:outer membrane protein assembly factor BamB